ncbi:hypothetical protein GCM10010472_24240 [Pseudonocardia halophobica]|uniref:Xylose isomerase-like TIM barrel domain-containing protein n=1 Tax=Pseudonocardia halophobica TaxID=29401 RepID=A0A9W6NUT3_9PSEU|nr:TIM barrel protein [Pseudonocardia halophobica]GLL09657.1 hypothetical protein GCM10017577_07970 [Pseudonocardia halophobica]
MPALPRLGTTLYSFTPEFHGLRYSLADLVRLVAERGLGPGLEMVGFQSVRGFPHVDPAFAAEFRDLVDRHGLEPSCLAINVDRAVRRDRVLTGDETVDHLRAQVDAAVTLGFPLVRVQNLATVAVMEKLLPHAERVGVTLAMELHAPETVRSPWVQNLLAFYERAQSERLGFIPDFGASTRRLADSLVEEYRERGVPEDILDLGRRTYAAGEHADHLIGEVAASGASMDSVLFIQGVGLFGHQDPQDWREIGPWIRHVHGKFYDIDPRGDEPTIDYRAHLELLVEIGYTGYVSSEWEAWHWVAEPDAADMISRHHALERRILDEIAARPRAAV